MLNDNTTYLKITSAKCQWHMQFIYPGMSNLPKGMLNFNSIYFVTSPLLAVSLCNIICTFYFSITSYKSWSTLVTLNCSNLPAIWLI